MRVTAPHQPDMSVLHPDLNQGKWTTILDLREESDRQKLRELILDADVVVQGYRPGVLEKYGFGRDDILELCKHRERGIIYARENCFGWNGPDQDRIGWQQVSDAVSARHRSRDKVVLTPFRTAVCRTVLAEQWVLMSP